MSAAVRPVDPAVAELQREMAAATDPELRAGIAAVQADADDAEADRQLGATMRSMVDAAHGDGSGARFRDSVIVATRPGTPQRKRQDRAWSLLAARLEKLAGDGV